MPKTLDVATTALPSVERVLAATGHRITAKEHTPGAVGYTRITITPKGA